MPAQIHVNQGKARLVIPSRGGIAAIGGSQVPGAFGEDGEDGREVQLQKSATHIQWRYAGEVAWTNLVALSELQGEPGSNGTNGTNGTNGADGQEVELQKSATHIQWRYVGAASWTNLVALSELQGEQGEQGEIGFPGFKYDARRIGADQYVIGEIIEYGGSYFICLANNDAITPTGGALGVYWAAHSFGGGGSSITGTGIAYVRSGGNDTTGTIGSPSLPYLTAQAAWDDGARNFDLGDGSYTITYTANSGGIIPVYVRGLGPELTSLSITWMGTAGTASTNPASPGGNGGTPEDLYLYSDRSVDIELAVSGGDGGDGAQGDPGTGESSSGPGGTGGNGGAAPSFSLNGCFLSAITYAGGVGGDGGLPGQDNGGGSGSPGSAGGGGALASDEYFWCDLPSDYVPNTPGARFACLQGQHFLAPIDSTEVHYGATTVSASLDALNGRAVIEHYMRDTDFFNSSGSIGDVTGLSCSVAENEKLLIEIVGFRVGGAALSGLQIAFTGPSSPTHVRYTLEHWNAVATGRTVAAATAFNTTLLQVDGSTDALPIRATLTLMNGSNPGTVQFRAASENSGTSITFLKGMTMKVYRIP